jgi:hypothetical protein
MFKTSLDEMSENIETEYERHDPLIYDDLDPFGLLQLYFKMPYWLLFEEGF